MPPRFTYSTNGNWYKGNLHLHTRRSDGHLSVKEAVTRYHAAGYDFVAVTDHWQPFQQNGHKFPMLVLEGVELDGYDAQGSCYHVLAIGLNNGLETCQGFEDALASARDQGALLI